MLQQGSSRQTNSKRKKKSDQDFASAGELVATVDVADGSSESEQSGESLRQVMEKEGAFDHPSSAPIPRDIIEVRAYEIWLSEGCPEGRELEHWRRAEEDLRQ